MCLDHSPDTESICLYYYELPNYPFFYWLLEQDQTTTTTTTTTIFSSNSPLLLCKLYVSSSVYCISSLQSLMPTAAWWVVRSTAPSWLKTTPSCGPCCSLCATTTELISTAPMQDDPGRIPSCCWMGESASKTLIVQDSCPC